MKQPFAEWDDATLELVLEEVAIGLDGADRERLLARVRGEDLELFERAAAATALAGLGQLEQPPAALMARLQADASAHVRRKQAELAPGPRALATGRARIPWRAAAGWVTAALLLIAFLLRDWAAPAADPTRRRDSLVASASDLVQANWTPGADPLSAGLGGDVVWSSARQEGYLRFRGLRANDPKRAQYQLWIFDSTRDEWEAKPVDGGVFDVAAGSEVVVPIVAKLEVRKAALFAVTLEAPGGVVVSRREHLLATAAP